MAPMLVLSWVKSGKWCRIVTVEFGCEMCIRLFLYPAIHTEYIDDNSVYSMAEHPGGAAAITLT